MRHKSNIRRRLKGQFHILTAPSGLLQTFSGQLLSQDLSQARPGAPLQKQLVTALAVQGEVGLAETYCSQFGLDAEGLPLRGAALAESRAARDSTFRQLQLPPERVHFVDTAEASPCCLLQNDATFDTFPQEAGTFDPVCGFDGYCPQMRQG